MRKTRAAIKISLLNLKSVGSRLGSSGVVVIGIAGVVAVLVSMLSMVQGFRSTLTNTSQPDRALILRAGSDTEINGNIQMPEYAIIRSKRGLAKQDGIAVASRETYVTVRLPGTDEMLTSVPMRGVTQSALVVRPELKITAGRMLDPSKHELIVGEGALGAIKSDLSIDNYVNIKGINWHVVGHFTSNSSANESELWVGERILAGINGRGSTFSSMLVRLSTPEDFEAFRKTVEEDPRLTVRVLRESDYHAAQSQNTTQLILQIGGLIVVIMAIGSVFAATNTMYSAISQRTTEIATLKSLGFGRAAIFCSVLTESFVLASLGGLLGGLAIYLAFNNMNVATAGGSYTRVNFVFSVTPWALATGVLMAVTLGLIGGAIPAYSAIKRSIVSGLKAV